jgi:hypothetical protein
LAIKILVETLKPCIILLHEIIRDGENVIWGVSKFKIGWNLNYNDVIARFVGNITRW